jgi:hypothetical protein
MALICNLNDYVWWEIEMVLVMRCLRSLFMQQHKQRLPRAYKGHTNIQGSAVAQSLSTVQFN